MKCIYPIICLLISAIVFSCSEAEEPPQVSDVTFGVNIPSLKLVYEVTDMAGRVSELPVGFTHAFGGVRNYSVCRGFR